MTEIAFPKLRLYHYWRSSSSWRVRWGFALKNIAYQAVPINLLDDSTDRPDHRARNPHGFVPVLEFLEEERSNRRYLTESLAILQWADELVPTPTLFPADPYLRARAWALAEVVNAGTHPLQNLPVQDRHSADPAERKRWAKDWIHHGLSVYEKSVADTAGKFSVGDALSIADLCLGPQCYNAVRYEVELAEFSRISEILTQLKLEPSYQASEPDRFAPP